MQQQKLREVSRSCAAVISIVQQYGCCAAAPLPLLQEVYEHLRELPSCLSILCAYEETTAYSPDHVPETFSSEKYNCQSTSSCFPLKILVFQMVADFIRHILPNLIRVIKERGTSGREDSLGDPQYELLASSVEKSEHSSIKAANDASALLVQKSTPVEDTALKEAENLSWDSISGCEEAKCALKKCTLLPKVFPQIFLRRRSLQCILLYGPPGTGKTLLAKTVASEAEQPFFSFNAADILSKWLGESEKCIQNIFEQVSTLKHSILFFDEIDALCGTRGSRDESEVSRRVKTQFLLQLQQLPPSVTVIAASNLPWEIDPAIRRRFDRMIYVSLPSSEVRRELLARAIHHVPHSLNTDDLNFVIEATNGYSASDVLLVAEQAISRPLDDLVDCDAVRKVDLEDFEGLKPCTVSEKASLNGRGNENGNIFSDPSSFLRQSISLSAIQFIPCHANDPRSLSSIRPDQVPENLLWVRCVCRKDFEHVLGCFVPSVTRDVIKEYEAWKK